MNIITIKSPKKTKVIKRIGQPNESKAYIEGFMLGLNDIGVDTDNIVIKHEYINNEDVKTVVNQGWYNNRTKSVTTEVM